MGPTPAAYSHPGPAVSVRPGYRSSTSRPATPPITNEDSRIGVALNGEIYNFRALRDELDAEATAFAPRVIPRCSPTSPRTSPPWNWPDASTGCSPSQYGTATGLVLGRDRVGKKPLYYWCRGGRLVFASEIKGGARPSLGPARSRPGRYRRLPDLWVRALPRDFFAGVSKRPARPRGLRSSPVRPTWRSEDTGP